MRFGKGSVVSAGPAIRQVQIRSAINSAQPRYSPIAASEPGPSVASYYLQVSDGACHQHVIIFDITYRDSQSDVGLPVWCSLDFSGSNDEPARQPPCEEAGQKPEASALK